VAHQVGEPEGLGQRIAFGTRPFRSHDRDGSRLAGRTRLKNLGTPGRGLGRLWRRTFHAWRPNKFPYGDFHNVHRCGLLAAESRAGQRNYHDIELAVGHLHGRLEALQTSAVPDGNGRPVRTNQRRDL
jgi:hypothetical protein